MSDDGPIDTQRVELAEERLQLVEMLGALRPLYFGRQGVQTTCNGGWTHPWKKVDALQNYLLLTCFDVLGGKTQFMDFQSWLLSNKAASERDFTLSELPVLSSPVDAALFLHKSYLSSHGTTQTFYHFLRNILPLDAKQRLFYSIKIREIDIAKNIEIREIDEVKAKEIFLFGVRNRFTHEGSDTGSPAKGLFPNWGEPIMIDGVSKMGWEPIFHTDSGNYRIEYSARNWPASLVEAVTAGITTLKSGGRAVSQEAPRK